MSDGVIPNEEAELLLHRYVTERVPILAWFVSADKTVKVKLNGFVASSTRKFGIAITSEWPDTKPETAMPSYINLTGVNGSWCQYSDETEVPADHEFGSGLILNMPSGDTLTILEFRTKKNS